MKKFMAALAALALTSPVMAEPEIKENEWKTLHSMGCMLLRECTEGVHKINNADDLVEFYPGMDITNIKEELNDLIVELNRVGVEVFLASDKYFPPMNRGVYTTEGNKFFLNMAYMHEPETILSVTRHEGWHAVQDCMAGSLYNSSIAIVWHDGVVPEGYRLRADIAYGGNPRVVPWEAEAIWAGDTPFQTVNALRACQSTEGAMWDIYPPTPMTGEWLINNGYWDGETK